MCSFLLNYTVQQTIRTIRHRWPAVKFMETIGSGFHDRREITVEVTETSRSQVGCAIRRLPTSLFLHQVFRITERENVLSRQFLQIWIERYQSILTDTLDHPLVDDRYGTSLFVPFYEKGKKNKQNKKKTNYFNCDRVYFFSVFFFFCAHASKYSGESFVTKDSFRRAGSLCCSCMFTVLDVSDDSFCCQFSQFEFISANKMTMKNNRS